MKRSWFYILLSLASDDQYGSAIQEDVRELSGGKVRLWPATLYGSLDELLERGWIRQLESADHPHHGGRERFYRISDQGRDALEAEVERMEGLASVARSRLEPREVKG